MSKKHQKRQYQKIRNSSRYPFYIMNPDGSVRGLVSVLRWGQWMQNKRRHVAHWHMGNYEVSTSFLGIDYSFNMGPLMLFETMVFKYTRGKNPRRDSFEREGFMERYSTKHDAGIGHSIIVDKVVGLIDNQRKRNALRRAKRLSTKIASALDTK